MPCSFSLFFWRLKVWWPRGHLSSQEKDSLTPQSTQNRCLQEWPIREGLVIVLGIFWTFHLCFLPGFWQQPNCDGSTLRESGHFDGFHKIKQRIPFSTLTPSYLQASGNITRYRWDPEAEEVEEIEVGWNWNSTLSSNKFTQGVVLCPVYRHFSVFPCSLLLAVPQGKVQKAFPSPMSWAWEWGTNPPQCKYSGWQKKSKHDSNVFNKMGALKQLNLLCSAMVWSLI